MKCKLNSYQYRLYKNFILKESQESDSQKKAIEYYINRLGSAYPKDESPNLEILEKDANEYVRKTLRKIIPPLNANSKAGKYTLGVCKLCLEKSIYEENYLHTKFQRFRNSLSIIVKTLTNNPELYKNVDKDFNGMNYETLVRKIYPYIHYEYEDEVEEKNDGKELQQSDYTIVPIENFQQSSKYGKYTSWCVTHYENMYKHYTNNGQNKFYFLLKKGFENVEKIKSNKSPFDEYGLSMIAISITQDGTLNTATSRWNHDIDGYGDNFANIEELEKITKLDLSHLTSKNNSLNNLYKRNPELVKKIRNFENGFDPNSIKTYGDLMIIKNEVKNLVDLLNSDDWEMHFRNSSPIYFNEEYDREEYTYNQGYFYTLFFRDINKGYIFSIPSLSIKKGEITTPSNDNEVKFIHEFEDFNYNDSYIRRFTCLTNYVIMYNKGDKDKSDTNTVDVIIDKNGNKFDRYGKIDSAHPIFPKGDEFDKDYRPAWTALKCGQEYYLVDENFKEKCHLNDEIYYSLDGFEYDGCNFIAPNDGEGDLEPSNFIQFIFHDDEGKAIVIYDKFTFNVVNKDELAYSYKNPTDYDIFVFYDNEGSRGYYYSSATEDGYLFDECESNDCCIIIKKSNGKYNVYPIRNKCEYSYNKHNSFENIIKYCPLYKKGFEDEFGIYTYILKTEENGCVIYDSQEDNGISFVKRLLIADDKEFRYLMEEFKKNGNTAINKKIKDASFLVESIAGTYKLYDKYGHRLYNMTESEKLVTQHFINGNNRIFVGGISRYEI